MPGIERSNPPTPSATPSLPGWYGHGNDAFLVADLAGHARLATTRLYSLPTEADRQQAVESLVT